MDFVGQNIKTPLHEYLSAIYKKSFAFYTVKERMPVTLTQTIDNLARNKTEIVEKFGEKSSEELKEVIGELARLKYELQTNKPFKLLEGTFPDVDLYNFYLEKIAKEMGQPTFFNTIWLYSECFFYRRIKAAFDVTETLKDFDYFREQKQLSFKNFINAMIATARFTLSLLTQDCSARDKICPSAAKNISPSDRSGDFVNLLKLNLWGNKCDLSLSNGKEITSTTEPVAAIKMFEENVLCDHSEAIWKILNDNSESNVIDIIHDNAGYELFTDLCLADYLTSQQICTRLRLHVKAMPWFVSDVTTADFSWTIRQLRQHENISLRYLGDRWHRYLEAGVWTVHAETFWTLPMDYTYMKQLDAPLYEMLAGAKLVIFKGDLNYRKLLGEKNWEPTEALDVALQGFRPTKLCTIRTVKADIICGLEKGVAQRLDKEEPDWMTTGKYGLIQCAS